MAEEADLSFGKVAIDKGFISTKQLDEATEVLQAVRKLGLEEDIGSILVKKKYLTPEQAREIRQLQGQRSGMQIAGYEILEKIGQGGMGVVFKARQVSLDRIVALKILNPKLAADKAYTERFMREARAVAKLGHPNIIVGIDVGQHGKYFYFAMEYVEGRTGLEILREEERFKEKDALKIAQQITRALDHAHKNGLVHRDIKPDNIMVTAKGEAKLCDLGLAKRLDTGDNLQPGTAVGTPHYIAPEQARGRDDVDIRADIYALGASLYHMTTSRTLFHGETAAAIMTHHLSSEAPNAKKVRPELSEQFCRLLERMLAKNPEDRYQTPLDLLEELDRVVAGKPIKGLLKPDAPCSMEHTARRARVAGQFSSRGTSGPRTPIGPPDPTTGPRKPVEQRPTGMIMAGAGFGVLLLAVVAFFLLRSSDTPDPQHVASPDDVDRPQPTQVSQPDTPDKKAPAVKAAPQPKPSWKPLEMARQASQSAPEAYVRLIGLYESAEQGAPRELLPEIQKEKKEILDRFNGAIERKVEAQWEQAHTCMGNRDYTGALACFADDRLPLELKSDQATQYWNKKRVDLEQQIYLEFHQHVEPELGQEIKKAEGDVSKLEAVRAKLQAAVQKMPLDSVKDRAGNIEKILDALIKQSTAAKQRAQFETFKQALEEARTTAGGEDVRSMTKAADKLDLQRPLLAEGFRPIADQFSKDLRGVVTVYEKAWEALTAKGEAQQEVDLYYPEGAEEKRKFQLAGKVPGAEGGVWFKGAQGVNERLAFSKLDDRDVLELAGISKLTDEGKKQLGVFFFWRGDMGRAYELLLPYKAEKSFGLYVVWMDLQARELISDVEDLYRQTTALKLSGIEKERRRRRAEKLVLQLKNDFSATEVYRERTQEK